jgi:hypothetical protein
VKRITLSLLAAVAVLAGVATVPAQKPAEKPAKKYFRGRVPMPPAELIKLHTEAKKRHGDKMAILAKNVSPPPKFSCADLGWMPPQDDQGQCGSCYLVSSAYVATSAFIKAGWGKNDGTFWISSQYGLDCKDYGGCNGGDEAAVINDMRQEGFPAQNWIDPTTGQKLSDYGPYTAAPGACQLKAGARLWKLQDWGYVSGDQGTGPATLDQWKAAMLTYGCISIAIDASFMESYSGGVATQLGDNIDHAVKSYAWDDTMDCGDGTKGAVCIKNNWGTGWGIKGDCWVAYHQIKHIIEPIWVLAPTVAPPPGPSPGPGPGPGPSPGPSPGPGPGPNPPPAGAPVINSARQAAGTVGVPFSYQITATNSPTRFAARALPAGLSCNTSTGVISGTPTAATVQAAFIGVANSAGYDTAKVMVTIGTTPQPGPGPAPSGVTITLTPAQVASVLQQAGHGAAGGGKAMTDHLVALEMEAEAVDKMVKELDQHVSAMKALLADLKENGK